MNNTLIFDTDIGTDVDDAFAISILSRHALSLAAIIATTTPVVTRAKAAKTLLQTLSKPTPVFMGMEKPISPNKIPWITGKESESVVSNTVTNTRNQLLKFIKTIDTPITFLTTAPLTTAAWLLKKRNFIKKVRRLVVMGGTFKNAALPQDEHNFAADPVATQLVFQSIIPLFLVPLSVTLEHPLTMDEVKKIHDTKSEAGELISKWTKNWLEITHSFPKTSIFFDRVFLHDPITAIAAIKPELFSWERKKLTVNDEGLLKESNSGRECMVCVAINPKVVDIVKSTIFSI